MRADGGDAVELAVEPAAGVAVGTGVVGVGVVLPYSVPHLVVESLAVKSLSLARASTSS